MATTLNEALAALTHDGDLIRGTADLVECVKDRTHLSYRKIAEIAGVTEQGIKRWRDNNSGAASRVRPLIDYANTLISQPQVNSVMSTLPSRTTSITEGFRSIALADIEACLNKAITDLFGLPLGKCSITRLESLGDSVKLELHLQ